MGEVNWYSRKILAEQKKNIFITDYTAGEGKARTSHGLFNGFRYIKRVYKSLI